MKNRLKSVLSFIFCFLIIVTPATWGVEVKNPDKSVWARIGWNLGWVTNCGQLKYSEVMEPHRKVKKLRDDGVISERNYAAYTRGRSEWQTATPKGCKFDRAKNAVEQINNYLDKL